MKILSILFLAIILSIPARAIEKIVPSKITNVTVFQQGAQIYRNSNFQLKKGRTEVVFSKLSHSIDINSIQVSGRGVFTILSVYHRINYLEQVETDKSIQRMMDSVEILDKKVYYLGKMKIVYEREYELLNENRKVGGQNGMDVESLKKLADYFRSRMTDLQTKYADLEYEIKALNESKARLQNQINTLNQNRGTSVNEILIEVDAEEETQATIDLSYIVYNAGWTPIYDLRAVDVNNPLELHYKANVYQNCGEDWDNVKLSISTGNPRQNGTIPTLYTWYLQYRHATTGRKSLSMQQAPTGWSGGADYAVEEMKTTSQPMALTKDKNFASNSSNFTTVNVAQTNTIFEISIPYTIPSSGKQIQVKVQKFKLNAQFRYYTAPKLDPGVFLEAQVTGWEDLNLISGNMNIFFEGTFVGKSYLNSMDLDDTLSVSLGRDESIIVKREKIKDKNSKSLIGGTKKETTAWEISIKNTKNQEIKLVIEDQIPLSNQEKIEVEVDELSGASKDNTTGIIKWELKIPAKQSNKLIFAYTIKYPKEFDIINKE